MVIIRWVSILSALLFFSVTQAAESQNSLFRQDVMSFVKKIASNDVQNIKSEPDAIMDKHWLNGGHPIINWAMTVSIYSKGDLIGRGATNADFLSEGLIKTTTEAISQAKDSGLWNSKTLETARFKVTFYYPPDSRQYSFVDDGDKTAEVIGNIVPVRVLDTDILKERILSEKAYLLRAMDPELHAFFKRYDATTDQRETKLRTIYTASSLFTLLKINSLFPDPVIEKQIEPIADFLLMMQEKTGKNAGAFHYSYNKETKEKDNRFVVGTASKTIFTLLLLSDRTGDSKYMNAAKAAGDWLATKVDEEGHVNPVLRYKKDTKTWDQNTKQSFLYSGQVLSALSRLYHATNDKLYYDKATLIANRFIQYVHEHGAFVGDDFRTPNSVSTSWMVMSLTDYAKINPSPEYRKIITLSAAELLARQSGDSDDLFNNGRVMDLISASGNGWVNEVMTVLYPFCKAADMPRCEHYRHFIANSSRWLAQNVYTPANSYAIKNPRAAEGGAIPNFLGSIVRTDAVCHGGNSLVGLLEIFGERSQVYKTLHEMPFDELLGLLGIGKFPEIGMQKIEE